MGFRILDSYDDDNNYRIFDVINEIVEKNKKEQLCKYCNRHFNFYTNKWKHEKICKIKDNMVIINKDEYEKLKNENIELKTNENNKLNNHIFQDKTLNVLSDLGANLIKSYVWLK